MPSKKDQDKYIAHFGEKPRRGFRGFLKEALLGKGRTAHGKWELQQKAEAEKASRSQDAQNRNRSEQARKRQQEQHKIALAQARHDEKHPKASQEPKNQKFMDQYNLQPPDVQALAAIKAMPQADRDPAGLQKGIETGKLQQPIQAGANEDIVKGAINKGANGKSFQSMPHEADMEFFYKRSDPTVQANRERCDDARVNRKAQLMQQNLTQGVQRGSSAQTGASSTPTKSKGTGQSL